MQTLFISLIILGCLFAAPSIPGARGDAVTLDVPTESDNTAATKATATNAAAERAVQTAMRAETVKIAKSQQSKEVMAPLATRSQNTNSRIRKNNPGSENKFRATLAQIARYTLEKHFGSGARNYYKAKSPLPITSFNSSLSKFSQYFEIPENYATSDGVFVTFYKNGKTRACWGSVRPLHDNLVKATIYAAEDAINKEYRHKPLKASELDEINVQVTVIKDSTPVNSILSLNPLHDGLLVRARGKGAVILPGEASDSHHQLVMAKLKAGISPNQSCELYRLRTDVYR